MGQFFKFLGFLFLTLVFVIAVSQAQAQNENPYPTPNTQIGAKPDPKKQRKKEPKIRYIIKNDTKNTLSGNRCFEEQTIKMGFQYIAVPKGQAPNKNGFNRFLHNFGVKTAIFFKNGPFWKSKLNKKYEACKYGSGDNTG